MENNILNEINNIIRFATEYPLLDEETEQHQEESAAEPTFRKIDENVLMLKW